MSNTVFKLTMRCDSAAFGAPTDYKPHRINQLRDQLVRSLREVANNIELGRDIPDRHLGNYQNIHDSHGNIVGHYALKDIDYEGKEIFPDILR
jgi:hypothetical protein